MRHFTSAPDQAGLDRLLHLARASRLDSQAFRHLGHGKRIGLIFLNPSLRTRLSTEIAARNLGLEVIPFQVGSEGWAWEWKEGIAMNGQTVEHIRDAAPVLGAYFDLLAIRTFPGLQNKAEDYSESVLQSFIRYCGKPVISLESATLHPLQSLADMLTLEDAFPDQPPQKVVLTWAPHIKPTPQCVANSFAQWMGVWGKSQLVIAQPPGYELDPSFTGNARLSYNQKEALEGADVVYVKSWSALHPYGQLPGDHADWLLGPEDMALTRQARLMHCLPVRRNVEVTDAWLDSPGSLVTKQAANRVWAAQAVIQTMLENG
jgi:N-succinyl-L-ornithine transcarbamylase